jgi:hypothetical protein
LSDCNFDISTVNVGRGGGRRVTAVSLSTETEQNCFLPLENYEHSNNMNMWDA